MRDTMYRSDTQSVITKDQWIADLTPIRVIYIGESHTNPSHHAIQLDVIRALAASGSPLIIGMEMFDHTYQAVLDRWSAGALDEAQFLQLTHWYANWRYDYALYRDILEYAKENRIRVVALNVPFHIPAKISVGGIDSLSADERRHLPETIDTSDADHRAYVENIFKMHSIRGRENFDFFYQAQCTWEDAMAEAIADNLGSGKMVVLAGNGHITRKFGIPNRAFARNRVPFKTVYLAPVGNDVDPAWADYIWATDDPPMPRMSMKPKGMKKPK